MELSYKKKHFLTSLSTIIFNIVVEKNYKNFKKRGVQQRKKFLLN